jgi:hypothetical protein
MAKLTEKEREGFERILMEDLDAINEKFMNQLKTFWSIARDEVKKRRGWDKLEFEKSELKSERDKLNQRIQEIEDSMHEEKLTVEQIVELGGKPDEYRYAGAKFYGIPVTSQFDYEIVDYIRKNIDLEIPVKIIRDVCKSSLRALTMSGSFEEAREAYEKFYSLDFRKFGVDIPPRLDDVRTDERLQVTKETFMLTKKEPEKMLTDGNKEGNNVDI